MTDKTKVNSDQKKSDEGLQVNEPTKKKVRNTNSMKMELPYGIGVITFQPNSVVEVPIDLTIPRGIGLFEV